MFTRPGIWVSRGKIRKDGDFNQDSASMTTLGWDGHTNTIDSGRLAGFQLAEYLASHNALGIGREHSPDLLIYPIQMKGNCGLINSQSTVRVVIYNDLISLGFEQQNTFA